MIHIADIDTAFRSLNAPYAIFGGTAIALIDPTRPIRDVDILTRDEILPCLAERFQVSLGIDVHKQSIIQLDNCEVYGTLRITTDGNLYKFSLDEAMEAHLVAVSVEGVQAMVLSREDHLVLKAMLRRRGEKGKQDLADMKILRIGVKLDLDYLRWRSTMCGVSEWVEKWLHS